MKTRQQIHQQYTKAHEQLLKQLNISSLGNLDTEEAILLAALELIS